MKQQEDLKEQEYFNQVLFTTLGSFEYITFKCSEKIQSIHVILIKQNQ